MKQEIEKIIHFVTATVHPNNSINLNLSKPEFKTLLDTVSIEVEGVRRYLIECFFNFEKQTALESLVQNYQSLIIKLLNDLYIYKQELKENPDLNNLYSSLSELLVDVLGYLETYLSKYFNTDQEIPHIYYSIICKDFQQQLSKLKQQFKDRSEDLELIAMITSEYPLLLNDLNEKTITYLDLIYRKELIRELNGIASHRSIYKAVKEVLLHLNFNHIAFFQHLIDELLDEYNKLETFNAKLNFLRYQRKLFRQLQIKPNFALFSHFSSIKDQVLNWIDEEIVFVDTQQEQVCPVPGKKEVEQIQENKISVALSVAQLAFLIRVLTLGKVITNNNQSEVIRIFASAFKTYKTEDISYGSLYGKYFKPEASTIKEVKSVLLQLVNLITKIKE